MTAEPAADPETSSRRRILAAAEQVLARRGRDRLSLSEVATTAGVSRPTLYRLFASKTDLLRAFTAYELDKIQTSFTEATAGLEGDERLDALLAAMVEFQSSYSLTRRIDVEPGRVLSEMGEIVPVMRTWLVSIMGAERAIAAAAVARIAIGHYTVPSDDAGTFLDQLRHAAGLPY